ncbi:glycosyltransferase [Tropicimonas sp. TH_r6]|uniref:glycosyltransferase n=1 Tax=Tropicimonas sp. TH_r6 TaxID=3082085 RepID=UPI002952EC4A|nr:glycosyltransferase [Tropicimonas sp. TH_r6]MDV7142068.1 glycosyltransferase [Tropicimonas sp. TH_r6]
MRILLAHNNYIVQGGAEVFFHEVARVLEANGHEVLRFSAAEPGLDDVSHAEHFPSAAEYKSGTLLSRTLQLPKMIYNREAKAAFARMIERFKPDVIHAFAIYIRLTPSILDAAREAGVPVVLSCNDYKHICPNYKLFHHGHICEDCKGGRFYKALANRCCHGSLTVSAASMTEAYFHEWKNLWRRNVSMFLFASRFMADKTLDFWGEDSVRIDYLQNPFDADKYHVDANVGDYMLYFGRLIDEKGVDTLVDAAERVPEIPVVVVGDGPDLEKLEMRARQLDNLRVVGPAWGADLAQWQHGARAVVVPSIWHENFPYVILQAFAASNPVIGTRRGGIPELIEAGPHGWTYEAGDAEALAALMREVRDMPDAEIARMGAAACRYTHLSFSDAAIYERLRKIYGQVIS